ncbi:hypothetical protein [Planctobacterium marinum]|uniref:Uncharacterized protein n=1 Tax=Planctobacterium marinum TaxID=1631968 RepID=A0AA48HET6_9ALTE|nr:hypothetical protein MACH26_11690 [Planctobacterium marinum]
MAQWKSVAGIIVQGHQVASGKAKDSPYPDGSIPLQMPFFRELGLDLSQCFPGTLNVAITPHKFKMLRPSHIFEKVEWIAGFNAETFSFAECKLVFGEISMRGYVHYPHPETKTQHFHNDQLLEVLCPFVEGIRYGDKVRLEYLQEQIDVSEQ